MLAYSTKLDKNEGDTGVCSPPWNTSGAGGMQATRLAALEGKTVTLCDGSKAFRNSFAVACGAQVYQAHVDVEHIEDSTTELPQGESKRLFATKANGCNLVPLNLQFSNEVQSLEVAHDAEAGRYILGAVDEMGFASVIPVDPCFLDTDLEKPHKVARSDDVEGTMAACKVEPLMGNQIHLRESSWAGVTFAPGSTVANSRIAVTHQLSRETLIHDFSSQGAGRAIRRIGHAQNPNAAKFISGDKFGNNVIGCVEWHGMSIWDVRSKSPVAKCVSHCSLKNDFSSALFALDVSVEESGSPLIAVGGRSRLVTFLDSRTWKTKSSWKSPLKHDMIGIRLSSRGTHCYAIGLDNEFVGYDILNGASEQRSGVKLKGEKTDSNIPQSVHQGSMLYWNHRTFRAASKWIGFDVHCSDQHGHTAVGVTQDGIAYALTHTERAALGSAAAPGLKNVDFK